MTSLVGLPYLIVASLVARRLVGVWRRDASLPEVAPGVLYGIALLVIGTATALQRLPLWVSLALLILPAYAAWVLFTPSDDD